MLNGGRMLKRGYTFDPECGRTSHRLRLGQAILRNAGVVSTHEHGPHWDTFGACYDECRTVWPEWATDEMFEHAWRLADAVQTERGRFNTARIPDRYAREQIEAEQDEARSVLDHPGYGDGA